MKRTAEDSRCATWRRRAIRVTGVLLAVGLVLAPAGASAQRRVALVIGNAAYVEPDAKLTNPVNDARDVAEALGALDFDEVFLREDLDREGMEQAVDDFVGTLRAGDVAVFYYAGHGLELDDGENYLAPVDFSSSYTPVRARNRALQANEVQALMEEAGARTRIVILDACRNNPFERVRSLTRGGLGQMTPRGGLVAYATEAGDTAADNGLYAQHLVAALRVPGLPAMELFTRVSEAVEAASGGTQVPIQQFGSTVGRFVFHPGNVVDPVPWEAGEVFWDCPTCPEMVVIPAGRFRMGCVSGRDCEDNERPVHEVQVSSFALGVYEVTFEEYERFARATGHRRAGDHGWGRGRRPVVNVSWEDAKAYVAWLSQETGESYRLPSESEWEYAARAGSTTRYSWGQDIGRNRANCRGCGSRWDGDETAPAGSFAASAWGLHDMHGNVWEWVEDCWHENYARAPRDGSAWTNGGNCVRRVLRGGSWYFNPALLRSANRSGNDAGARDGNVGFRVSRTLD